MSKPHWTHEDEAFTEQEKLLDPSFTSLFDYMFGKSHKLPSGLCPCCGSSLRFLEDAGEKFVSTGTQVMVGTVGGARAEVMCEGCNTLFTMDYMPTTLAEVEKRYPVNSLFVSLNVVLDQDEHGNDRHTPPGQIWRVESLEWNESWVDHQRVLICDATGASGYWETHEISSELIPLGDHDLLAFEHDGFDVQLPHRDCGACWNLVDPQIYGFKPVFLAPNKEVPAYLERELPDGAGFLRLTGCYFDVNLKTASVTASAGAHCVLERFNRDGVSLAKAALGVLEDKVLRDLGPQSPDDVLSVEAFTKKYQLMGKAGGNGEHPEFTRDRWMTTVCRNGTDLGYWDWAFRSVLADRA